MSDEEAHAKFVEIRWADNGGQPVCPRCGGVTHYTYKTRKLWKCKPCTHSSPSPAGTIFASRKLPVRDILLAIAIVCNGAKGISALQLGARSRRAVPDRVRALPQAARSARGRDGQRRRWRHRRGGRRLRRRPHSTSQSQRESPRPSPRREPDRQAPRRGRRARAQGPHQGHRHSAGGRWRRVRRQGRAPGLELHADEAAHWDALHAHFETKRINHTLAYSLDGACTNQAESFLARLRRMVDGQHHRCQPAVPLPVRQPCGVAGGSSQAGQWRAGVPCAGAGSQASGEQELERVLATPVAVATEVKLTHPTEDRWTWIPPTLRITYS